MDDIYDISLYKDNLYVVTYKQNDDDFEYNDDKLFIGTLPEVEAWISLTEKGFEL